MLIRIEKCKLEIRRHKDSENTQTKLNQAQCSWPTPIWLVQIHDVIQSPI